MNISLTPQLEELVKSKVASGLYGSASEVMREALRLLEERDRIRAVRLEELREEYQKGLDSGEAGPLDIEDIKARGRKRLAAKQKGEIGPKGSQDYLTLYRRAFEEFGAMALWNVRRLENPTRADALAITRTLRVEGNLAARLLAEQIEEACRGAL